MSLQERLKLVLKNSGLTIPDFANRLGVAGNTLVNYREGRTSPTYDLLMKICTEFSISAQWLLLGVGSMDAEKAAREALAAAASSHISPLDQDLLQSVVSGVEKGLDDLGLVMEPDKKAQLIILLYDHYVKTRETPDKKTVERYLRLVA